MGFLKKSRPLIVFSQAKIGIYTAESLLEKAREAGEFPPVIVFADRGSAAEARSSWRVGAKDYWLEPLMWEENPGPSCRVRPLTSAGPLRPNPGRTACRGGVAGPRRGGGVSDRRAAGSPSSATIRPSAGCWPWPAGGPVPGHGAHLTANPAKARRCSPVSAHPQ
jgi:hypothetical protein